jgi:cob(I)alamin adenosyltransferase
MSRKIYTKTGDRGKTSLIGGTKVAKNDLRIEAYGSIDELNSFLGLLRDQLDAGRGKTTLGEIQDRLFTIGATLARDPEKETSLKIPDLHETDVAFLEQEIDAMESELPEMKSFLLPGGHVAVSTAHICRTVCRRAERNCVSLSASGALVEPLILVYLNRLSDYLFVLARFIGHQLGASEVPWHPRVT